MSHQTPTHSIDSPSGLPILFRGPPLSEGPLPALFYLALSAEESLTLSPFCQPTEFALRHNIRVFSCDLPGHGPGLDPNRAIDLWTSWYSQGLDPLKQFLEAFHQNIDFLVNNHYVIPKQMAIAGLSRGGLLALHTAAKDQRIKTVVGFAPLTTLTRLAEMIGNVNDPIIQSYAAEHLIPALTHHHIRFYIGNNDQRVNTDAAYQVIRKIALEAYEKRHRDGTAEFIMTPSVGHKGHGTSPQSFQDGIDWAMKQIIKGK